MINPSSVIKTYYGSWYQSVIDPESCPLAKRGDPIHKSEAYDSSIASCIAVGQYSHVTSWLGEGDSSRGIGLGKQTPVSNSMAETCNKKPSTLSYYVLLQVVEVPIIRWLCFDNLWKFLNWAPLALAFPVHFFLPTKRAWPGNTVMIGHPMENY